MIVITGATGHFGRQVVEGLLKVLPASQVGVSVRDPEKAGDLAALGVRVARGDFADPVSLRGAFDSAEQLLVVSVNQIGEEAIWQHGNAIQAAKDAGVGRILYTSHQAASSSATFIAARDHAATEKLLQTSGLPFVSLRNGFYAESALYQLSGLSAGKLVLPADGPVSWTARTDLAAAAVAALTKPELFDGFTPPLTASEALDFGDIAALASELLGRNIERAVTDDSAYRDVMVSHGFPKEMATMLLTMFWASRMGEFNVVDPALGRVLGRSPTSMREVVSQFLKSAH